VNAGAAAETLAAEFLEARGLAVVKRTIAAAATRSISSRVTQQRWCSSKCASRSSSAFGGARASVTAAKRRRIKIAASLFLSNLRREPPCRFDAILVDGLNMARIEWLVNIDIS
jgi:putative endonuclease